MKLKKVIAIGVALLIGTPSLAHASDIVMYDASNLDDILVKYAAKTDPLKDQLQNVGLAKDNKNQKPGVKAAEEEEDLIEEVEVEGKRPDIHPKTPVYTKVVDISEHQNPSAINYDKFAKDIDGAILRASITTYKIDDYTGERVYYPRRDHHVDTHYRNLNKRNVPIGFYHYSRATNPQEATREANYVLDYVKDKNVSLPIYLDIEDSLKQAKSNMKNISSAADTFLKIMERNGYVAGVYSYPNFAKKYLTKEIRNRGNFWLANYVKSGFTRYKETDFDSWQYTEKGRVKGYNGNVDKSFLYKDYPLIIKGKSRKNYDDLVKEVIAGHWSYGKERRKRLTYAGYDYKKVQTEVNRRLRLNK
ncbi:GH25 family lysozyme [uncultured Anaerococcus sp.]|uniref:GH25 family lysozyme n=1 Tax=uncultured Anaerococcus sp. TaxID=293428 RepID=UPI00288AE846|nr:GH25 family lysozyme [uncultured Anaerococcus sp.]